MTIAPGEPLRVPDDPQLKTPRAAGLAGLAFAALFVTSLVLLRNHPSSGSSASEMRSFYLRRNGGDMALVGVYLVPFAFPDPCAFARAAR